jgi:hypothetical protein
MPNKQPFVAVACFCEHVIEGKDGVLSIIRIIDSYHFTLPTGEMPAGATPAIPLTALIALRSGDVAGTFNVRLVLRRPDGTTADVSPEGGWPIVFNGAEHGVNLTLQFPLGVRGYGLYWFDLIWEDGVVLTSMPIKLVEAQQPQSTM